MHVRVAVDVGGRPSVGPRGTGLANPRRGLAGFTFTCEEAAISTPNDDAIRPTEVRRLMPAQRASVPAVPSETVRYEPDHASGADWRRIGAALLRFKWIVIGVTLLGTLAGLAVRRVVVPAYAARATLWVDIPDARAPDRGPIQTSQLVGSTGWVGLLESHLVLGAVVRDLRLYLSVPRAADTSAFASFGVTDGVRSGTYRLVVAPEGERFALLTEQGDTLERGVAGDSVGAPLGLIWVPSNADLMPGRLIDFTVRPPDVVAGKLANRLRVRTDLVEGKVGTFMTVELHDPSPSRVTTIVNAVAARFVAVAWDLRRKKLSDLAKILGDQLGHAQANLVTAEQALRDFRVRAATVLSTGAARDPVYANFFETKVAREQLRRDQVALERVLGQADSAGLSVDALEAIGAVQQSSALTQALRELTTKRAELRALRYRYTDAHPPVQHLAAAIAELESHTIPALVRRLATDLAARRTEMGRDVDAMAGNLRRLPPLDIQEKRLEREVSAAAQLFEDIQQRFEEVRLAKVSSLPEVRILDGATLPEQPLFNATPLLIVVAFTGSLLVAGVGAVVVDRFDPRVRYPEQVTGAMGLSILGAVPHVHRRNGDGGELAAVTEALRALRLRVVHAHGGGGPVVLTITSPGRSDGKSFVASNLALAFADAGHRTLLIDGDVRRGSLHRVLGAARKPGLTELLAGEAAADQVVRSTEYRLLSFIGCGTRTRTAPELLGSAPMRQLVTRLTPSYDAILVDSPPLAAGVDAYALGTITGSLLVVLRTGYSNRELAEAKLDVLDRLPIRLLGAVLNDVREGGAYRYYSYYLAGYELSEEEPRWRGRPLLRKPD